jgi:hypothetical protein
MTPQPLVYGLEVVIPQHSRGSVWQLHIERSGNISVAISHPEPAPPLGRQEGSVE